MPRIAEVLADRQSTITNYLTASEELKSKAEEAERAYTQALNDARSEASRLLDASKAEMKKELLRIIKTIIKLQNPYFSMKRMDLTQQIADSL